MPQISRRARAVAIIALASAAVSGCEGDPAGDAVRSKATSAATVMQRPPVVDAGAAVARVVGGVAGDTIEAMAASGTNRNGRAVLRITATASQAQIGGQVQRRVTTCFAYDFAAMFQNGAGPDEVDCPSTPAITVTPESPEQSSAVP